MGGLVWRRLVAIAAMLVAVLGGIFRAEAQSPYQVSLQSISPDVTDVSNLFTDRPPRSVFFLLQGSLGSSYTATFSVTAQPSVVVGVGIDITSLTFDDAQKIITMSFNFVKPFLSKPGAKPLPRNVFLLTFDPGRPTAFPPRPTPQPTPTMGSQPPPGSSPPPGTTPPPGRTPPPRRGSLVRVTEETECYGPGNQSDRDPGATDTSNQGPPIEARGTYMSTDILNWCVIPPQAGNGRFGFRLTGPAGDKGFFKMYMPPPLVQLLADQQGESGFSVKDLGIFNDGSQASINVQDTGDGGALVNVSVTFSSDSTVISNRTSPALGDGVPNVGAASSTSSINKSLTVEEQEDLSLAPKSFTVTSSKVNLYGFGKDETTLVGQKVTLSKSNKTVGTATINADGSYSTSIKTTKVFGTKKRATLTASTTGNLVLQSRSITLTNRSSR